MPPPDSSTIVFYLIPSTMRCMTPGEVDPTTAAERESQLLRGVLDMCLLTLLIEQPAHGYELVRRLNTAGFSTVSYGTVYPLLTRMRRLGLIADGAQNSPTGPPRKVFTVTPTGRQTLNEWTQQWIGFTATVNAMTTHSTTTIRR
jgi:PadR family transcriptional regulator, regulatory protein PadR